MCRFLAALMLVVGFIGPAAAQMFTLESTPPGIDVWRLAPMPDLVQSYPYYPVTIAYNTDSAKSITSKSTKVQYAWLQWANRCDLCASNTVNHNPNSYGPLLLVNGLQARTSYTTYAKADAATLAAFLSAIGEDWRPATRAAGIPDGHVITYAQAAADPARFFTNHRTIGNRSFMTATDLVVLAPAVLSSGTARVWGILCDCEFADLRPASSVTPFMAELTRAAHRRGYKFAATVDDLLGSGRAGGYCGLGMVAKNCDTANLNAIANIVDGITIAANNPPPKGYTFQSSLDARLALFGPPGTYPVKALILQFVLGIDKTTIENAREARRLVDARRVGAVLFAPIYDKPTGEKCTHTGRKISIVLGLPEC